MPVAAEEQPGAIRAAILDHVALTLQAHPAAPSAAELDEWTAGLNTTRIVRSLGRTPNETAANLVVALGTVQAGSSPDEAIADLVRTEFPDMGRPAAETLTRFARAVRTLHIERDGQVTAADLFRAGFGSAEAARLMPMASRVLDVLGGIAEPRAAEADTRPPIERLRDAGARAAVRSTFG